MPTTRKSNSQNETAAPSKRPRLEPAPPTPLPRPRDQVTTCEEQRAINVGVGVGIGADPSKWPIAVSLSRHKEWREAGSPHDTMCFVCFKPQNLEGCDTCRRAYHTDCMPASGSRGPGEGPRAKAWYCDVCVDRGWHENPPMITPPESPVLRPSSTVQADQSRIEESQTRGPGSQQLSNPPALSAIVSRPAQPVTTQSVAAQPIARASNVVSTANEGVRRGPKTNTPTPASALLASRKSRYNTLSEDVESALTVLYRELEKIPFLEQKITDLESELSRLNQEVRIQRNELALSRRMNVSTTELQRLRMEAAGKQDAEDKAAQLQSKNEELEAQLAELRDQSTKSNQSLQDLKQKLSNLIGD
ncbi:hypothetical protein BJY04DRAFT_185492 [Aspergillus karnatakaensis]|uniref:uncharacterized protein n=1 Tax=Aspergillus karnatakaensis TaxID=1810916 RepID=UPI003CCDA200